MRSFISIRMRLNKLALPATLVLAAALALAACQRAPAQPDQQAPTPLSSPPAAAATEAAPLPQTGAPSVTASDQGVQNGKVVIAEVVSSVPGWIVIYSDKAGAPNTVLGQAPVKTGENTNIEVVVDEAHTTGKVYAMLHVDGGVEGTFEFPGPDAPAQINLQPISATFTVTSEQPLVHVHDQELAEGKVTVATVVSPGPGWIVIYADEKGSPGAVVGHTQLNAGINNGVVVELDLASATPALYAMLHVDDAVVGEFEFPGGDAPLSVDGQNIVIPFAITGLP